MRTLSGSRPAAETAAFSSAYCALAIAIDL